MAFCHGNGDPATDGCCHLPSGICPQRLKVVEGRVLRGPLLTDLGTVDQFVRTLTNNGAARNRASQQVAQGLTYACLSALRAIVANPASLTDRAALEAGWLAETEYARVVATQWRAHEQANGLPPNSLDCPTWKGEGGIQCCFGEDPATNEAKAAGLSSVAVSVRRAGGLP
jgi:hypothetical protein